ncbi:ComEC/Rec2 family competence protein, partial [Vibrio parahaemolyticus]|uniref:ComEC/Rec2 family competence protein n=1 Tax=Vibrio parahaemolyticus TaxID=670 RepID=UPI0034D969C9
MPAQRTVWMLLTVALLQQSGRRWPWPLVLLAAACVVTLFDPWALLQPGFWLSFGA